MHSDLNCIANVHSCSCQYLSIQKSYCNGGCLLEGGEDGDGDPGGHWRLWCAAARVLGARSWLVRERGQGSASGLLISLLMVCLSLYREANLVSK